MHSKPNASQRTHGSLVRAGIIATLTMILASGCESAHKPTATKPPPPANLDTQTAGGVTRAFLTLLCEHCTAMAVEDQERADRARDQIIWHVLDRNALRPMRQRSEGGPILGGSLPRFRRLVESWASAVMYYADGFAFDQLSVHPTRDDSWTTVRVPAHGPNDDTVIHIACLRDAEDQWRVVALDFEPEAPVSTTTTQPAAPNP